MKALVPLLKEKQAQAGQKEVAGIEAKGKVDAAQLAKEADLGSAEINRLAGIEAKQTPGPMEAAQLNAWNVLTQNPDLDPTMKSMISRFLKLDVQDPRTAGALALIEAGIEGNNPSMLGTGLKALGVPATVPNMQSATQWWDMVVRPMTGAQEAAPSAKEQMQSPQDFANSVVESLMKYAEEQKKKK